MAARAVRQTLETFLGDARRRALEFSPRFAALWDQIAALAAGGKGLRPHLVALSANALGTHGLPQPSVSSATGDTNGRSGDRNHDADEELRAAVAQIGAAFELLHTGLVLHDDVIDRDDTRRHRPTVHAAARQVAMDAGVECTRAAHYGFGVGIVAGDLAVDAAYRLVATAAVPPEHRFRILELIHHSVFASAAGELLDIDHALPFAAPAPEEVLAATRLKTAVYTFEAPLQAGAVLAGAQESAVAALGRIGAELGLAYQLADDLLGVFGSDVQTGKPTDGDLREGKNTLLMAEVRGRPEGQEVFEHLARKDFTSADAARVRHLLESLGARAAVARRADDAVRQAQSLARQSELPQALVEQLCIVARSAVERIR